MRNVSKNKFPHTSPAEARGAMSPDEGVEGS